MRRNFTYFALFSAFILASSGCAEENLNVITPAEVGDEILFGARAGFENGDPETKTIYSGVEYTYNGTRFERIDWITKQMSGDGTDYNWYDMIEIYSPEAVNGPIAHYEVHEGENTPAADNSTDYAYLLRSGNSSLQWGEGSTITDDEGKITTGVHHFYAMYPSRKLFEGIDNTLFQGIRMDGSILTGIVPTAQSPERIGTDDSGNYIAVPNMKYAYMAARTTASKEDGGNVKLTFVPVVTAVEIELELSGQFLPEGSTGEVTPVTIGEIQVQGTGIAGEFTANLSSEGENAWGKEDAYPTCVNTGNGYNNIQISVWDQGKALTLAEGKTLTFTVFMRPGASVSDLVVRISPTGAGYISKKIENKTIRPKVKTRIKNLYLPAEGVNIDAGNWMDQLDPETEIKRLSIPGTGGSFSYLYIADEDGYFRSQHTTMTLQEQWKLGIRAFEIVSDRSQSRSGSIFSGGYRYTPTTLYSEQITCNKSDVGKTVGSAVDDINTLLSAEGSDECAVIIFTYQPEDDNPARNAEMYATSLKMMYDNLTYKDKFTKYTPDIKIKNVTGQILVFVRLNQRNEKGSDVRGQNDITYEDDFDKAAEVLKDCPFVLIDGCGTAKDKWGARGYYVGDTKAVDISNGAESGTYVEEYMQGGFIDISNHSVIRREDADFSYGTETDGVTCWFQEWARVIPEQLSISAGDWQDNWLYPYPAMYWFPSYDEKLQNIEDTFQMATSDLPIYQNYLFINSLCGYKASQKTATTVNGNDVYSLVPSLGNAYGGDGGEIKALADALNPAFYKYVLSAGLEQTTGPTGVILMDYVSSSPANDLDGSYYLPGVIISNNFKFNTSSQKYNAGSADVNDWTDESLN